MARHGMLRRFIRRIEILVFLVLALVGGLVVAAFYYVQDGDFVRQRILTEAPRFFPTSRMEISHARLRPLLGECVLEHLRLWQDLEKQNLPPKQHVEASVDPAQKTAATSPGQATQANTGQPVQTNTGSPVQANAPTAAQPGQGQKQSHEKPQKTSNGSRVPTLRLPFVRLLFDPWKIIQGEWEIQKVIVAQPTLRLARGPDGKWNIDSLIASPLPIKPSGKIPTIQIVRGTLELIHDGPLDIGVGNKLDQPLPTILRDVELTIEMIEGTRKLRFDGSGQGSWADRFQINGIADLETGTAELNGSLLGLKPGPKLFADLAPELIETWKKTGLDDLESNLYLESATIKLTGGMLRPTDYRIRLDLLRGRLQRAELPFPLNDIRATLTLKNDALLIERAEASHGKTLFRVTGKSGLSHWRTDPLDITLNAVNLAIDQRLQKVTPPQWQNLWVEYLPRGELNLAVRMVRDRAGGEIGFGVNAECRDVAICYEFFPYPLEHIWGQITWSGDTIRLGNPDKPPLESGLRTLLGNRPAAITGTIRKPGPQAEVDLVFEAENLTVDETLLNALPPDARRVVDAFQPSGEVRAKATITRRPPATAGEPPIGKVDVHTTIDLLERCSIRWSGMPYPVHNLKGRLQLHPDQWVFENMSGTNGTARITGHGKVERVGPRRTPQAPFPRRRPRQLPANLADIRELEKLNQTPQQMPATPPAEPVPLKTHIEIHADHLPFDDQLRQSLPAVWQKTWSTINPNGSAKIDVLIDLNPSQNQDSRRIAITPDAETRLNLVIQRRGVDETDQPKPLELALDQVQGQFVSQDGKVSMEDVRFLFRNSVVTLQQGQVVLESDGKFDLWANALEARDLHLDATLRQKMSPVMSHFARRLDDGRTITFKSDLRLGWSGKAEDRTWCRWDKGLIVLNGNSFDAGWKLNNLQGQVENISGIYDGYQFSCDAVATLDSMTLKGFPIHHLSAPIHVENGLVQLPSVRAIVMGGQVYGEMDVQIANEPQYHAGVKLVGLDLAQYARTVPGPQSLRGRVSGDLDISGRGSDNRNLKGNGSAEITQGDLGELPDFLRFVKTINLSPATKTAFDSAQVNFQINSGETTFNPIKFQGDAFSLDGDGTMSSRGELDVRLKVVYGRDRLHLPLLSDAVKEATGQLIQVRIAGTPSFPEFRLDVLPSTFDALKTLGDDEPVLRNPLGIEPEQTLKRFGFGLFRGMRDQ